jgi:hypothetical protein
MLRLADNGFRRGLWLLMYSSVVLRHILGMTPPTPLAGMLQGCFLSAVNDVALVPG